MAAIYLVWPKVVARSISLFSGPQCLLHGSKDQFSVSCIRIAKLLLVKLAQLCAQYVEQLHVICDDAELDLCWCAVGVSEAKIAAGVLGRWTDQNGDA